MTDEPKATPYDDLTPISIMGDDLLDRHNDRIATFEKTFDERERIVQSVNEREILLSENKGLKEALNADMSGKYFRLQADRAALLAKVERYEKAWKIAKELKSAAWLISIRQLMYEGGSPLKAFNQIDHEISEAALSESSLGEGK